MAVILKESTLKPSDSVQKNKTAEPSGRPPVPPPDLTNRKKMSKTGSSGWLNPCGKEGFDERSLASCLGTATHAQTNDDKHILLFCFWSKFGIVLEKLSETSVSASASKAFRDKPKGCLSPLGLSRPLADTRDAHGIHMRNVYMATDAFERMYS